MTYIDTNIVILLYLGKTSSISQKAKHVLRRTELLASPMVRLELQYLYELGRITVSGDEVLSALSEVIMLSISKQPFAEVCEKAESISWTRDTFDRLIVAEAALNNASLVTCDRTILKHYKKAIW